MSNNDNVADREILDTKKMLEDDFLSRLGKIKLNPIATRTQVKTQVKTTGISDDSNIEETKPNYNTEKVLTELYDTRDSLIETLNQTGIGANSNSLVSGINKVGSCIRALGGKVDNFDPYANMSGLQTPTVHKNAKKVIENTKESYSLGKISNSRVNDDGTAIEMTFEGIKDNMSYKCVGTIVTPKAWLGNEAIDYVYSPGEGRMSVKAFNEEGKWMDRSANYKISWELSDGQIEETKPEPKPEVKEIKEANNVEIKEEKEIIAQNDMDNDISDDFEIKEN